MERLLRCISLLLILSIGANAVTVSSQAKTTEKEVTLNREKHGPFISVIVLIAVTMSRLPMSVRKE